MGLFRIWVVAALVAALCAVLPAAPVPGCQAMDLRVAAPYPISGYWLVPRADRCLTRRTVEAIHNVGGDTLITFGPRFAPSQVDRKGRVLKNGEVDPVFADCAGCAAGGRRVYTYAADEAFGPGLLRCPARDRRIERNGRVFHRLMLGKSCEEGPFDVVLVASDGDGVGNLLVEAATAGMSVFPGLPSAPQDPAKPWLPDLTHLDALTAFTARVVTDYRQRYGTLPAFAGVYQSFELTMRKRPRSDPTIAVYRAQHAMVASALPGKKIVVSPYLDARRERGFPPGEADDGFAAIADTRAGAPMAISVQDGRGVGKVPLYWPGEGDAQVEPRLVPMVGQVSNRKAYLGSEREYVDSAASAVRDGVELWVNVESFEPTPVQGECGRSDPLPLRGRTTKARIDLQIMAAGRHPTKIISYGWDPFLTCQNGYGQPALVDDLVAGWRQPIIVHAEWRTVGGRPGIAVEGHNLGGVLLIGGVTVAALGTASAVWAPFTPDPRRSWLSVTAPNSTNPYVMSGHLGR